MLFESVIIMFAVCCRKIMSGASGRPLAYMSVMWLRMCFDGLVGKPSFSCLQLL